MRWLTGFLVLFCLAAPAAAEAGKPYLPRRPTYEILVIGDSLAAGLWSGLARMAESDIRLSVDGRYKEDSGLSRPEFYDWSTALPKILAARPFDVAVILVGSNDPQSIRDGNARYAFGTPDWVAAYAARVDGLLAMLKEKGIAVYWVSPPPMATPNYNESIQQIAAIQKQRAEAAGARYVDIRTALSTPDGRFTDRGLDETGADRRLRSRDGVHFMKSGNNRIGSILLAAIRADIDGGDRAVEVLAQESVPGSDAGPVFGQEAASGAQNLVRAAALKIPDHKAQSPQAADSGPLRMIAGSGAERLFTTGESPKPPAGRFDDFSAAAPN